MTGIRRHTTSGFRFLQSGGNGYFIENRFNYGKKKSTIIHWRPSCGLIG